MDAKQSYYAWLNNPYIDDATKKELLAIQDQEQEIYNRFSKQLEFGTGGLRGIIGAGTNRMNIYTVRLATQAYAQFLYQHNLHHKGVFLACDSRHMSQEFVMTAASVLVGNGIPVYVFREITPTPLLSFAVRNFQAGGGIMITASHNTKEYNGYKAYNHEGVQLLPKAAAQVSELMAQLTFADVKIDDAAQNSSLWRWVGDEVYQAYFQALSQLAPPCPEFDTSLRIVYTPLHGTGAKFVPYVLHRAGFQNVQVVTEQMSSDGDFPTVTLPNPEEHDAFTLAFAYAKEYFPDIILATDPDGDRVGVAVYTPNHSWLLTGNQVGVLLADYLLHRLSPEARKNKVIVKTIVSTPMINSIAAKYGVEVIDTLTGFKYIGTKINQLRDQGKEFLFGFEESCGYLAGTFVGDKDAIMTSLLVAQMAAYYRKQNMTLWDRLIELMHEYGYYRETLQSYYFSSQKEAEQAEAFIEELRQNGLREIAGIPIKCFRDYRESVEIDLESQRQSSLDFPKENVLQWETIAGDLITLRPSGTEPKMKLYISIVADHIDGAEGKLAALLQACDQLINQGLNAMAEVGS